MQQDDQHIPMPPIPQTHLLTTPPQSLQTPNIPLNLNLSIEFDDGALLPHQRDRLLDLLQAERLSDRDYLRKHPEVQAFVNLIFRTLIESRPENLFDHLDDFFRQEKIDLAFAVQKELDDLRLPTNADPAESAGGSEVTNIGKEEAETDKDELDWQSERSSLSRCWGSLVDLDF